jgi:hypothetical protein
LEQKIMSESNISTILPPNTKPAPVCAPKPASNNPAPAAPNAFSTQPASAKNSRRQVRKQH